MRLTVTRCHSRAARPKHRAHIEPSATRRVKRTFRVDRDDRGGAGGRERLPLAERARADGALGGRAQAVDVARRPPLGAPRPVGCTRARDMSVGCTIDGTYPALHQFVATPLRPTRPVM